MYDAMNLPPKHSKQTSNHNVNRSYAWRPLMIKSSPFWTVLLLIVVILQFASIFTFITFTVLCDYNLFTSVLRTLRKFKYRSQFPSGAMLTRFNYKNLKDLTRQIMYVPKHKPPDPRDFEILGEFINRHQKVLILTGAGISTESGIPDYRSEEVGLYARSNHKPVQYQEFVKYPKVRQRYWARNFVGWPRFSEVQPNDAHIAINKLEQAGKVTAIVTQNVDRLHQKAGSKYVIELHGSGYIVKCLSCPYEISRTELQKELLKHNPAMESSFTMIRPDGDVELSKEQVDSFQVPLCPKCEGPLKPDIVFFGDNVPKHRVAEVRNQVTNSNAVFVLGSSLTVYSSYRIILQAKEENKEVALLNIGPTRADKIVDIKVSTKCGDILPKLCNFINS